MAGSTLNIADFRCRGMKARSTYKKVRTTRLPHGLTVLESEPAIAEPQSERLHHAQVSENPTVFDIGIAREAQRTRPRLLFHPVPIQRRRATVIRFGEPGVTVMQPKQATVRKQRAASSDFDLPPAA
jgi:hypothetical protein